MSGIKTEGFGRLGASLRRIGKSVPKKSAEVVRRGGIEIERLSRAYAPIDTGDLEGAITRKASGAMRDGAGRFTSGTVDIYVDPDKLNLGKRKGFDYSVHLHETPFNLGELSKEKQAGQSEIVGSKYMKRAFDKVVPQINKGLRRVLRETKL